MIPEIFGGDIIIFGHVGKEPWYSNGHVMLKGTTPEEATHKDKDMTPLFDAATKELFPAGEFRREIVYGCKCRVSEYCSQVIQADYWEIVARPGWTLFIGGKTSQQFNNERYVVAKCGDEVVAIVAPMRKP